MESWNPSIQNWIAVLPGTKQAVISIASSSILTPDAREEKNNLFIGYWNRTQDACLASGRSFHHPKTSLLRKAQGWFLQGSEVRIPAKSCSIVEPNRRNYYFFGRPEIFFSIEAGIFRNRKILSRPWKNPFRHIQRNHGGATTFAAATLCRDDVTLSKWKMLSS